MGDERSSRKYYRPTIRKRSTTVGSLLTSRSSVASPSPTRKDVGKSPGPVRQQSLRKSLRPTDWFPNLHSKLSRGSADKCADGDSEVGSAGEDVGPLSLRNLISIEGSRVESRRTRKSGAWVDEGDECTSLMDILMMGPPQDK